MVGLPSVVTFKIEFDSWRRLVYHQWDCKSRIWDVEVSRKD